MDEIVEVVYDVEKTDFQTVAAKAKEQECAQSVVLVEGAPNLADARRIFGVKGVKISSEPCEFRNNDPNYQHNIYRGVGYFFNSISPLQATRMHAEVANRADYLSPRQDALRERIEALFKGLDRDRHEALFKQMQQALNPSQYRNLH
jgi:hypothetical protein